MTRRPAITAFSIRTFLIVSLFCLLPYNSFANQAPVLASAPTFTPSPATVNQMITFMASATDPENDPLTYSWSIDDGFNATGAVIVHTFAVSGNYTATVTVSDGKGGLTSGSVAVFVADTADSVPLPPSITIAGTSITVTPASTGQLATGYRVHYNPMTDNVRQFYKDSAAFASASGAAITLNASQLSNFKGGNMVATAFNANGQSHYSMPLNMTAAITPAFPRYADVVMLNSAQCCCRARCQGTPQNTGHAAPRFKSPVHAAITNNALGTVVNPLQLTSVVTNDIAVDVTFLTNTEYHFDAGNVDGSIANIQTQLAAAQSSPLTASVDFGIACHPLQDFYSHTNFVENWLAANANRAATVTDDQLYQELPALTGGDPTLMGKYYSGYFEGVTLLGGLGGTGGYSTYALPQQVFITIYQDMETGEARPNGYKLGFVPWHGIINKDNEVQREGMSLVAGQSTTLFAWAQRFATIHTKKLYDSLNQPTKDALSGAPATSAPVADQINNLISGMGTPGQNILGFGQNTSTLQLRSSHPGLPVLSSLALSLNKPSPTMPIKGDLAAQAFIAVDVSTLGTLSNTVLTGSFKKSRANPASSTLGTIKLSGSSIFYFTNVSSILTLPGRGRPPFDITLRPAKIQVTGTLDNTGAFTSSAFIQVKGGKGARTENISVTLQAQVSP